MDNLPNVLPNYLAGLSKDEIMVRLSKLTDQEIQQLSMATAVEEVKKAKDDLFYYLTHMVFTQDEHDSTSPIKPLPIDKEYLQDLAWLFLNEPLLLVEKSRQMLVTWIMVACHLWDGQFHEGRRIFFQSKKEKDANALVDRAKFIYNHYPEPYATVLYTLYPATQSYLRLQFGKQSSIIEGVPQGADQIRMYTASRIFSDEMAFQDKAEEAFIAAKPTIVGGGSFCGVSTPNFKNFFYLLKSDEV